MLLMQNIGAEGVKASIISTEFRNHKIYDTILMEINDEFLPITPSFAKVSLWLQIRTLREHL